MPGFRGQLPGWHHYSGKDIHGMNDILWEGRKFLFPTRAPSLPYLKPKGSSGGQWCSCSRWQGDPRDRAVRGGRDAEWKPLPLQKQKSPLETLDITSSCPGPLPSLPLSTVDQQQQHRPDLLLLLIHSVGSGGKWGQTHGQSVPTTKEFLNFSIPRCTHIFKIQKP
jgi:hypothetical protein